MKIRLQRISRTEGFAPLNVDHGLVQGTVKSIRPGEEMTVQFARLDEGVLNTTKVERIEYLEGGMHIYTKNSIYRVLQGWDE